jgi:Ni/Co efflux regulator RcnB
MSGSAAIAQSDHRADGHHHGWAHDRSHRHHSGWARDRGNRHHWRRGQRMGYNDWNNASRVDYRQRHLRRPPHGYEWRESNGHYVLAAVATGLIASIILNAGH